MAARNEQDGFQSLKNGRWISSYEIADIEARYGPRPAQPDAVTDHSDRSARLQLKYGPELRLPGTERAEGRPVPSAPNRGIERVRQAAFNMSMRLVQTLHGFI